EDFKVLVKTLNKLEEEGQLVRTRKNLYGLPEKMNLIRGKVEMHKKGFAFLIPDDESEKDVYIHSSDLSSAMNNDKVIVRIEKSKSFGFVIADDQRVPNDIFIPKNKIKGAVTGHKVLVSITKFPKGRKSAEGEVIKILGHKNDPGIDILSIIYKHGLKLDFPENVLN